MEKDIRWKQRYSNYQKALAQLNETSAFFVANKENSDKILRKVSQEALIKCFEFTIELAWQTMRDFLAFKGNIQENYGSRDSVRDALRFNLIENGQVWQDMIDDRNRAAHAYNESNAVGLADKIIKSYLEEFNNFDQKMSGIK